MAPLTIKAKLSEEDRRDVHSDQRPVEPDGGRPACRGCLMGLRRFKVFYCTIKAILGDNTAKQTASCFHQRIGRIIVVMTIEWFRPYQLISCALVEAYSKDQCYYVS